jgi:hemoglobin
MKKDIAKKKDIELLVNRFYDKVKVDTLIGPIFNDVAHVNWEKHLPVMYAFWENIIFQTGDYAGNPMTAHYRIHNLHRLGKSHFDRWKALFIETTDELFSGTNAELAKQRALSIATVMEIKLFQPPIEPSRAE